MLAPYSKANVADWHIGWTLVGTAAAAYYWSILDTARIVKKGTVFGKTGHRKHWHAHALLYKTDTLCSWEVMNSAIHVQTLVCLHRKHARHQALEREGGMEEDQSRPHARPFPG